MEELKLCCPSQAGGSKKTSWSARSEAVKDIHERLDELVGQLKKLPEDEEMIPGTKSNAKQLEEIVKLQLHGFVTFLERRS